MKSKLLMCVLVMFFSSFICAYAYEPIPITLSNTMNKIIFDGRWTFEFEWKASSLNEYSYDGAQVVLRTAHQDDYVYVLLDSISDEHPDKANDYAVVCFDTKNNKSPEADLDDYCFVADLGGQSLTRQGDDASFQTVPNHEGFIGIGAISDTNDRYTPMPHPSYEFRIPTDLIGRESVYGFYFLIFDGHSNKTYTYPQNLEHGNFVSSPSQWGEIYSPDKSLPEFEIPMLSLVASIFVLVLFARIKHKVAAAISR